MNRQIFTPTLLHNVRSLLTRRFLAAKASQGLAERDLKDILMRRFPKGQVKVQDISGGCGAMFDVFVEDMEFQGLTTLKQHKLVTGTLKDNIKEMHGLRIHTSVPPKP